MHTYTKDYYQYLRMLEEVMIRTILDFGVNKAERKEGYTGVWVNEVKIGFIGVRLALGYTMHGFSLNVNNDLSPFKYIIPCGIQGVKITSIREILNTNIDIKEVYNKLANHYSEVFQVQLITIENRNLIKDMEFYETIHEDSYTRFINS